MTKTEFYAILDEIVEEDPGTIQGDESLDDLQGWDSLSVVAFIAAVDKHLNATVPAKELVEAKTIGDLLALVADKIDDL